MAKKHKYHFDYNTLTFKKVRVSFKQKFFKFLSFITSSLVFSTAILVVLYSVVDSPKEKVLKKEIELYKYQFKVMNDRINKLSLVSKDLESRDDNIYRMIFEAEPVPKSVRNAGYGGADKYEKLQGYSNSDLLEETTKKIDKLSRQLYVQSKSFDEIFDLVKNKTKMLASIPAILPVSLKRASIVSGYGYRIHPIFKAMRMHTGIDIAAAKGTPVYASGDGVVVGSGQDSGYGIAVNINHGYGYRTKYAHLSKAAVRQGQRVKRGDLIGYIGSTGLSTAPHLHYEVLKNGSTINPVNYFYMDITPEEYQRIMEESSKVNQALS
ncbi:MAG: M23 family metallopeptidase [Bacteroidota bacterium]